MARQITTKEMYTDVNGNLIAQYYDPSIDDFVPFAEQSAVRILDKDGNPISSDNGLPVQLTGSIVKEIKEWLNQSQQIGTNNNLRFYGVDTGAHTTTSVTPLDISTFKRKFVRVENGYDVEILFSVWLYKAAVKGEKGITRAVSDVKIPAGSNKDFYIDEYPFLDAPFVGLSVGSWVGTIAPTSGSLNIWIFGGSN